MKKLKGVSSTWTLFYLKSIGKKLLIRCRLRRWLWRRVLTRFERWLLTGNFESEERGRGYADEESVWKEL